MLSNALWVAQGSSHGSHRPPPLKEKKHYCCFANSFEHKQQQNAIAPFPKPSHSFILQSSPRTHSVRRDRTNFYEKMTPPLCNFWLRPWPRSLFPGRFQVFFFFLYSGTHGFNKISPLNSINCYFLGYIHQKTCFLETHIVFLHVVFG